MAYFVFGICAALLLGVAILAIKLIGENRKLKARIDKEEDEESWS